MIGRGPLPRRPRCYQVTYVQRRWPSVRARHAPRVPEFASASTVTYTRLAWWRGWGSGHVCGDDLHHVVVGIVLAFAACALESGSTPGEKWKPRAGGRVRFRGRSRARLSSDSSYVSRNAGTRPPRGHRSVDAVVIEQVRGGSGPAARSDVDVRCARLFPVGADLGRRALDLVLRAGRWRSMVVFCSATIGVFFVGFFAWIGWVRLGKPKSILGALALTRRAARSAERPRSAMCGPRRAGYAGGHRTCSIPIRRCLERSRAALSVLVAPSADNSGLIVP